MNINKFTSCDCVKLLPEVLIDYIWGLAIKKKSEKQIFILESKELGIGKIQEIYHHFDNNTSKHQVFGFSPVKAVVEVEVVDKTCFMILKEESVLCSA